MMIAVLFVVTGFSILRSSNAPTETERGGAPRGFVSPAGRSRRREVDR